METNGVTADISTFLTAMNNSPTSVPAEEGEEGEGKSEEKETPEETETEEGGDAEETKEGEEGETEEEDDGELTPREKALLKYIEDMEAKPSTPVESTPTKVEIKEVVHDFFEGMKEDDIDDILQDKSKLNAFFNKIANIAIANATGQALEYTNSRTPTNVAAYVQQQVELHLMVARFYDKNPDLDNKVGKRLVGAVSNRINEKNPGISLDDLLKQAATEAKKLMKLKADNEEKGGQDKKKPAFASTKSSRGTNSKSDGLTELQKEMMALIPK